MNYNLDWSIVNDLVKEFSDYIMEEYGALPETQVHSFPQGWGSTALGYSGMGDQMMTEEQTIVLYDIYSGVVRVYFGCKRLAYQLVNPNEKFFEDLKDGNLEPQYKYSLYRRKDG